MSRHSPRVAVAALSFAIAGATAASAFADDAACIAASEQAIPLRSGGKLHDALKTLAICAAADCPAEVRTECTQRIEAIKSEMPSLIFSAKDGAGNDLANVKVTMDGAPLASSLDGRALVIDPGEHTFTFETPGQPPLEKKLVLRIGDRDRRENVVIGPPPVVKPDAPKPPPPSSWSTQKTLAIASGGLGLVGVGLGAMFGAYASSSQSKEKTDCSATACPNYAQGSEDYKTAGKDATASTVAFAAGGVFLATAVVLWVTAPKATTSATSSMQFAPAPIVGLGGAGGALFLRGDL